MKPISFPEQTTVIARDQPEYLPLPAWQNHEETISVWSFTWRERLKMLWTGRLYLRQLNFRRPLQPQSPQVHYPWIKKS